jgi:histidinol-phosphate aminotransferase
MTVESSACAVRPARGVEGVTAYHVPKPVSNIDLWLDGNEGSSPAAELLDMLVRLDPDTLRRYPRTQPLEAQLAQCLGVEPRQVLVTAGADDALDRACRAVLGPGRVLTLPVPTFEMLERYPPLVGAEILPIPWPAGSYPTNEVLATVGPQTGAVAVVSPNNPTGAVATADDLVRLSAGAPHALLIVDLAYAEFADEDLTDAALRLPNAVAIRSFSKAWGLAGLRVGYAIGPRQIIDWLRAAGSPHPTSGLSLALAARQLESGTVRMRAFVQHVRREREELFILLKSRGADPLPSQGNFVLSRFRNAERVSDDLAEAGIAVRSFPGRPGLESSLRITCPGDERAFARLCAALNAVHSATAWAL